MGLGLRQRARAFLHFPFPTGAFPFRHLRPRVPPLTLFNRIPNPYRGLRGLPADAWIVAATTLVNRAGMMALPFLVLYLTESARIPAAVAGLAISAYGLGGVVTAPVAGRLADRFGPFAVMRASLALAGVILLIFPLAHQVAAILALTFVWAVVAEAVRPATMAALTDAASPEKRKAVIALNRLAINLGMSVGPVVGGVLATVSFPLVFVVDGATSLLAALLLTLLLQARKRSAAPIPEHHAAAPPRTSLFAEGSVVWRDRAAMLFFSSSFLLNIVFTQHTGAMPLYLVRDLHYRESFYGALFLVNTMIIIALEVPLNLAMARLPTRQTMAGAMLLIAFGFGALGLVTGPIAIGVTVVLWTFGEMIFFPTATAYVAELAPPGRTGEYMGAFAGAYSLAMIVGPWFGVMLLDRVGAPITWATILVVGLVAASFNRK